MLMVKHTRILGWIYALAGGTGLTVGILFVAALWIFRDDTTGQAMLFIAPVFLIAALVYLLPSLAGGMGLLRNRPWARTVIITESVLLILLFPFGTALGAYGLWVLLGENGRLRSYYAAEKIRRLAALAADPVRCKYAEWIERGEYWTDEMIAYDLDLQAVVTCVHLRPIERAMRLAGIRVRIQNGVDAGAHCLIDLDRLGRMLGPPAVARYSERHDIDRSYLDPKTALFRCDQCASRLLVVHADEASPQTPWFPAEADRPHSAA